MFSSSVVLIGALVFAAQIGLRAASPGPALPSPDGVIKKMLARANEEDKNEQAFRQQYAWYRVRTIQEFNSKGEVVRTNQFRQDFYPRSNAHSISETAPSQSSTNQVSYRERDFTLTQELLDRFEFRLSGRETISGRSMIILDFQPAAKKLPVHSLKDKFINKAAGRFWVDEEEAVLVKTEFHLVDTVNIAAGIAGAVKQFQYAFERARTPEGLWYVAKSNWKLEARELFSQKRMAFEEHKENVLRLRRN